MLYCYTKYLHLVFNFWLESCDKVGMNYIVTLLMLMLYCYTK